MFIHERHGNSGNIAELLCKCDNSLMQFRRWIAWCAHDHMIVSVAFNHAPNDFYGIVSMKFYRVNRHSNARQRIAERKSKTLGAKINAEHASHIAYLPLGNGVKISNPSAVTTIVCS